MLWASKDHADQSLAFKESNKPEKVQNAHQSIPMTKIDAEKG
jgi:hypothetical protein